MKTSIALFLNKAKVFVLRITQLIENKWFKIVSITGLLTFFVHFLYKQYSALQDVVSYLTLNFPLLFFSSLILFLSILLSIFSWGYLIFAFGFNFLWIDIAHTQMLSTLGKYIPGHIWNYSSKIFLNYKLGFPIKLSGFAVIIEITITYLIAISLFLFLLPSTLSDISLHWLLVIKLIGLAVLILLVFTPVLFSVPLREKLSIKSPKQLIFSIAFRIIVWVLSSYGFLLLGLALGYPSIGLSKAISIITSSFVVGFFAIFTPDGLIIRETLIIFFLQNILTTAEATFISLAFRFQLILLEFLFVLFILFILRIWGTRLTRKK